MPADPALRRALEAAAEELDAEMQRQADYDEQYSPAKVAATVIAAFLRGFRPYVRIEVPDHCGVTSAVRVTIYALEALAAAVEQAAREQGEG